MRLLLVLLTSALLAACAKSPRALYLRALDDHTELRVVYKGFGTALRIRGTYLSPAFRGALVQEHQRLLNASPAEHDRYSRMMQEDAEAYHEVVFTAESDMEARTEFGDHEAGWRIRLTADGVEEQLVTVYKVRQPTAMHLALFEHKNIWNDLWIARFARTVASPVEVRMEVGSGWGHQTLVWAEEAVR